MAAVKKHEPPLKVFAKNFAHGGAAGGRVSWNTNRYRNQLRSRITEALLRRAFVIFWRFRP